MTTLSFLAALLCMADCSCYVQASIGLYTCVKSCGPRLPNGHTLYIICMLGHTHINKIAASRAASPMHILFCYATTYLSGAVNQLGRQLQPEIWEPYFMGTCPLVGLDYQLVGQGCAIQGTGFQICGFEGFTPVRHPSDYVAISGKSLLGRYQSIFQPGLQGLTCLSPGMKGNFQEGQENFIFSGYRFLTVFMFHIMPWLQQR